ncbi:DUF6233 domain-containing protein [Streptomyces sp. NPDC047014]|uniref:DUF6233 domain-containing protein n=1 Tax=Streptomyces sp. NPDC047014 TaxID=3155736 RepID=UPI0034072904
MWAQIRELAIAVTDHPYWASLPREEVVSARMTLKKKARPADEPTEAEGVDAVRRPDPLLPLPPSLDQLQVIRRWLELTLTRVDERITALRAEEDEKARRLPLPAAPDWWVEYGNGARRMPELAHTGVCETTSRGKPSTAQAVRELLLSGRGVMACPQCRPDSELGLLDT